MTSSNVAVAARRLSWHRMRKATHVVCFAIFLALPFLDIMRFDIPRQRFYFLGRELWISEFASIFFALMLLLFLISAAALFYGRIYCAYLCPQMIFSEASLDLERRLTRWVNRAKPRWLRVDRKLLVRLLFYIALAPASVALAFVFIAYFVEPHDLLQRLLAADVSTAAGVAGAATTLLTFLDFAFLRLRFCTTVCPYGYLQGLLADDNTLLVSYQDSGKDCIECKKCVKICHMGIDIRTSAHQLECVHCGECIDACEDVLARMGKPGLIHYTWGEKWDAAGRPPAWYRRIGRMDPKRAVVLVVLLGYACALWVTLAMRSPVLVRLAPDRTTLFELEGDGVVSNRFRVSIANRGRQPAAVQLSVVGLDGARTSLAGSPLRVPSGGSVSEQFEVEVDRAEPGVQHFRFVATWTPDQGRQEFPMTFIAPEAEKDPQ